MHTILIIEDEPDLVRIIRSYLEKAGFHVLTAYRGDTGLSLWNHNRPDLVILDLNLPGMDGLDVMREIRQKAQTPLILLTARIEETDQLIGLELGADDYITKPFSPRILVSRVRALLRRKSIQDEHPKTIRILDLEVDIDGHQVLRAGESIELTRTEFRLLVMLAEQPGRVFERSQLIEGIQGASYLGYERTMDAHIKNLRAKLERNPRKPDYIQTVFGKGYRFARIK